MNERVWMGIGASARIFVCGLGVAVLLLAPAHIFAQDTAQDTTTVFEELRELYEADQGDRQFTSPPSPEEWQAIAARDAERQARVHELLRADALSTAEDFYHAAMVLQHGEGSEDILLAHILATAAAIEGHERGAWLSAAALDRYLHRTRQPQRLGTQYIKASPEDPFTLDATQPWSQGPYVRWLPDSVREVFDVIPLEEQAERVKAMNEGG